VPVACGAYAWYFSPLSVPVDTSGCHEVEGRRLLYVGISPKPPPANGAPPSRQQLRSRLRQHCAGNAAGSTLRLTFADGERLLSAWMATHAAVCWVTHHSAVRPAEGKWSEIRPARRAPQGTDSRVSAGQRVVAGPGFEPG
jgi:hypothetical protein